MKPLLALLPAVLLLSTNPPLHPPPGGDGAAGSFSADTSALAAEVRARVAAFADAYVRADAGALDSLLARTYVHTNTGAAAPIDRATWLGYVGQRRDDLASGRLVVTAYANDDLAVHVYGAAAVVTGRNTTAGVRDGTPFRLDLRFTQVWIVEDGRWRRAVFHDSAVQAR
jgi:hypothetical protein